MKSQSKLILAFVLLAGVVLVACTSGAETPEGGEAETAETPAGESSEVSEVETPAPETESKEVTLYVGPTLEDCVGVAPQKCMLVKENPEDEYQYFYDGIEGFVYEEGYNYVIRVRVDTVPNPPADASSLRYTLLEVVEKEPVSETETKEEEMTEATTLEGTLWRLDSYLSSEGVMESVLPDTDVTIIFQDGTVNGSNGCNLYGGAYETSGNTLTIILGPSTLMACPPPVDAQANQYMVNLSAAATYEIVEGELQIADTDGNVVLTFVPDEPLPLTGTRWQLTAYNNGKGGFTSVLSGTEITAVFNEDGSLQGSAGCNQYSATYTVDGENISISPGATTLMACLEPEGVMEQETAYLAALAASATYKIEGKTLELRNAEGTRLASYTAVEPLELAGTTWTVTSYNNGQGGVVSLIIGTEITAVFGEDGTLSGSAGCNNYTAAYEVDGENISIGPAATTRMFCAEPEGIMEQESQYLAALQTAATYLIEGDRMEMRTAEGSLVAIFAAADS